VAVDDETLRMKSRETLERELLTKPFDQTLRLEYADALRIGGEPEAAIAQYSLVTSQPGAAAQAHIGAALSLLALGRREEALASYATARGASDFAIEPQLEQLAASTQRVEPVKLTVLRGGVASDNVVSIERAQASKIQFDDIAGLDDLKRTIRLQIIEPFLRPGLFAKFKKRAGGGVLLYGPPGCGKTMMARAVAAECRAEFISVGISDVLNMYIGESERMLAQLFDKARAQRPCVMFFDELDALAFARAKASSEHSRQVVNEFLSQLDGMDTNNESILILAATNMPWDVDSAMKRPGRFARQVFVPPPDDVARARIVELKLVGVPHDSIDAAAIAAVTPHFSGADIEGLVEQAKDYVLEEHIARGVDRGITQQDLLRAARAMRPSTLDWLRTARNLVKYAGADNSYAEVDDYLKKYKLL
jgi:transitional endoplasmic reticulum ATPase